MEDVLDLAGIDVHAAADDHVAGPVGDEQVAVIVEVADVADGEVLTVPRRRRLLGIVVIAEAHAARRPDPDASVGSRLPADGRADTNIDAGPRQTHGTGALEPLLRRDPRRPALA